MDNPAILWTPRRLVEVPGSCDVEFMTQERMPTVTHVAADGDHRFSKPPRDAIRLIVGEGVEGDAHCGVTVKHRSRVRADPTQPNLRQVHLIHGELHDELVAKGFTVAPG